MNSDLDGHGGHLGKEFLEQATLELNRLEGELQRLDGEIANLQSQRHEIAAMVGHLQGLQAKRNFASTNGVATPNGGHAKKRTTDSATSADLVVEYLEEIGKPAHYRDIYRELARRGLDVGGKDPANTLLARYFKDRRLERVGRGTYALKN